MKIRKCVGWAKRPGANAFGGVPTTRVKTFDSKMVGTAQMRLCPPYGLRRPIEQGAACFA
jgi:hypothetical protein